MAIAPQNVTRIAPIVTPAPPARAANPPRSARNTSEVPETRGIRPRRRGHGGDQERHGCSNSEASRRCQCSLNRTRTESLGDAEFVPGMRAYRVMGHQLLGDLFRERRIEPASDIDCHQFLLLALVVCFEFRALQARVRPVRCLPVSGRTRTHRQPST